MARTDYYKFDTQSMFNRDTVAGVDAYVLTAYFVDPSTICKSGRNTARLQREGTGTGVWLQNGTDPIRDSVQVPQYENLVPGTKWIKGGCFPSMGELTSFVSKSFYFCQFTCGIQVCTIGMILDTIQNVKSFFQSF